MLNINSTDYENIETAKRNSEKNNYLTPVLTPNLNLSQIEKKCLPPSLFRKYLLNKIITRF